MASPRLGVGVDSWIRSRGRIPSQELGLCSGQGVRVGSEVKSQGRAASWEPQPETWPPILTLTLNLNFWLSIGDSMHTLDLTSIWILGSNFDF